MRLFTWTRIGLKPYKTLSDCGKHRASCGSRAPCLSNRPWFQLCAMCQLGANVLITEASRLRELSRRQCGARRPNSTGLIATTGPRQLAVVTPDDFVQLFAANITAGVGWQQYRVLVDSRTSAATHGTASGSPIHVLTVYTAGT
jgi:hypothetical protein